MHLIYSQKPVPPKDRFIRLPEVLHLTGLAKGAVYMWMKDGRFPANIRIHSRSVVWRESEVLTWMMEQGAPKGEQ